MTFGLILLLVFQVVLAVGLLALAWVRATEDQRVKPKVNKRLLACLHVADRDGRIGAASKITFGKDNADMWVKVTVERISRVGIYLDDGSWWPAHRVHEVHIQPVKEVD